MLQRTLVRCVQKYLRHHTRVLHFPLRVRVNGFFPPRRAKTPLTTWFEARSAEIVAAGGREVQELFGEDTGDSVVAAVFRTTSAVAVAVEPCEWRSGEQAEGFFEDFIIALVARINDGINPVAYLKRFKPSWLAAQVHDKQRVKAGSSTRGEALQA